MGQPGPVLVNGVPSGLLVDADQLTWWPLRDAGERRATDSKSAANRRRRLAFDQVIGIKRIVSRPSGRQRLKLESSQLNVSELLDGEPADSGARLRAVKRLGKPPKGATRVESPIKLKIYYAKRSETKTSGRLVKLKRLTVRLEASSGRPLCQRIEQTLEQHQQRRPKRLLVFVNPYGGKGKAVQLYKQRVKRLLDLANVETKLVVTKYANHARDTLEDPQFDVERYDGVVCVGGDGMFSELMNGLLFRCNRDKILTSELGLLQLADGGNAEANRLSAAGESGGGGGGDSDIAGAADEQYHAAANASRTNSSSSSARAGAPMTGNESAQPNDDSNKSRRDQPDGRAHEPPTERPPADRHKLFEALKRRLGGLGEPFRTPAIPIGVIGAGSTDCNAFGLLGTNDVTTATLNIILGNQIQVDVCSIHAVQSDRLLRFVSTFIAYGYFGDVVRESERLRWLGPSRYHLTGLNTLLKNQTYSGRVRILRSLADGAPGAEPGERCHSDCATCQGASSSQQKDQRKLADIAVAANGVRPPVAAAAAAAAAAATPPPPDASSQFEFIERRGPFVGVNAAVMACRCPQTRKGFSPGNHLANGCADLILVGSCSRVQYINYLLRTGFSKKSAFDLKYVEAYRCRQFEFLANEAPDAQDEAPGATTWNADGEILTEQSIRVKVNNRLLRVFGTGEPRQPKQ